jgi:polysaccharide biosynthesis protein VpsQ
MKFNSASVKIMTVVYVLILAVIIFIANTKSTRYLLSFIKFVPYGDKIGHLVLFGILSVLVNWWLGFRRIKFVLLGSIIVFLIVTIEEFSQIYISGRSFDLKDLLFDFIGIFLFAEIVNWLFFRHKNTRQ